MFGELIRQASCVSIYTEEQRAYWKRVLPKVSGVKTQQLDCRTRVVVNGEGDFESGLVFAGQVSLCHSPMAESQGAQENIPLRTSSTNGDGLCCSHLTMITSS